MLMSTEPAVGAVQETNAKVLVLLYKLDKIRAHINNRLDVVDPVTKSELEFILNMIEKFEDVPKGYKLDKPLVPETAVKG